MSELYLNVSLNLVRRFLRHNLPAGWAVRLYGGEGPMELEDKVGNEVSKDWEPEQRTLLRMVNFAREQEGLGPVDAGGGQP